MRCKNCGAAISEGMIFCPACGYRRTIAGAATDSREMMSAGERIRGRCSFCFQKMRPDESRCPHCGSSVRSKNKPFQLPEGSIVQNGDSGYLIGRAIGQGGFGITYAGWDISLAKRVAVKEYFPGDCASRTSRFSQAVTVAADREDYYKKGLQDFIREARILAGFSEIPGIVRVLSRFEANNTSYIIMEFQDGINLEQYISSCGTLSFPDAVRLLLPVLDALEQVHRAIIHRDVSPQNIMVLRNGSVCLLDFGAARKYLMDGSDKDSTGMRYGRSGHFSVVLKHGYAPPEQYFEKSVQGPWTDIYGLGATFYYMITGNGPEDARQRKECDHLLPPSAIKKEITSGQDAVIMKALSLEAGDRYQTIGDFRKALLSALPGSRTRAVGKILFAGLGVVIIGLSVLAGIRSGQNAGPRQSKYMLLTGDMTWTQARKECADRGGHLMTITSQEEFEEACAIVDPSQFRYIWLGARLESADQTWEEAGWITGEAWDYENWFPGEPGGRDAEGREELYLCMWNVSYDDQDIGWTFTDASNNIIGEHTDRKGKVACICEFD